MYVFNTCLIFCQLPSSNLSFKEVGIEVIVIFILTPKSTNLNFQGMEYISITNLFNKF